MAEKAQTPNAAREVEVDVEKSPEQGVDVQDVNDVELSAYNFTPEESAAITKKLDWHILPWIFVAYLFNSLDRGNVSAAQSDGMATDLNFPKNGYSLMLTVFYIPFSVLVVPGVMLTRLIGPQWTIPGYIIGWGAMATVNAAARNFGETVAIRMLLGAFEAGFAASLVFYLTTFYTRGELGRRIAVFYSCNCLSGAFSGLIAFGVFQMESHLHGWQILFLLEGALTVFFGICIRIFLPFSISTARFFSDREREVARMRVLKDGSSESGSKFNVKKFFKPLKDWKYYVFAVIAVCYGTAAAIAGTFLVQIVRRFGLSVVMTNLYTVAPYFLGTIMLLITSYSSDHFRERGFHLASAIVFVILGCGILAGIPVESTGVGYFATFLITCGAFTPSVLFHTWHQCNDPSEDGRAFRVGSFTFLANIGGIVGANIFQDRWAPRYQIPLAVICALEGLGLFCILGLRMWMFADNKKRNKAQGVNWQSKDVPTEVLAEGPSNPSFRHFY